jgi:hypothetical protein
LRIRAIQEPVFSVANTDFEDGDDDHGYGDCIFLVIYAQPSHTYLTARNGRCVHKKPILPYCVIYIIYLNSENGMWRLVVARGGDRADPVY